MADSPRLRAEGVVRVSVFSNGTALPDTHQLISVTVHRRRARRDRQGSATVLIGKRPGSATRLRTAARSSWDAPRC